MNDWFEGLVGLTGLGLLVPWVDGTLWLPWDQHRFEAFSVGEEEGGIQRLQSYKGRQVVTLFPSNEVPTPYFFLAVHVYPLDPFGEDAWAEALAHQGLERREGQAGGRDA